MSSDAQRTSSIVPKITPIHAVCNPENQPKMSVISPIDTTSRTRQTRKSKPSGAVQKSRVPRHDMRYSAYAGNHEDIMQRDDMLMQREVQTFRRMASKDGTPGRWHIAREEDNRRSGWPGPCTVARPAASGAGPPSSAYGKYAHTACKNTCSGYRQGIMERKKVNDAKKRQQPRAG